MSRGNLCHYREKAVLDILRSRLSPSRPSYDCLEINFDIQLIVQREANELARQRNLLYK